MKEVQSKQRSSVGLETVVVTPATVVVDAVVALQVEHWNKNITKLNSEKTKIFVHF